MTNILEKTPQSKTKPSVEKGKAATRGIVPTALSEGLLNLKREPEFSRAPENWKAVVERNKRQADKLAKLKRPPPSDIALRKVDDLAMRKLAELAGPKGQVLRPSVIFSPSSGPGLSSVPIGKTVSFPNNVEDIYQHFYVRNECDNDNNQWAAFAWGFFNPWFGTMIGGFAGLTGNVSSAYAVYDFSGNICPDDGLYLVNVVTVAWGKYTLYSDRTWRYPTREAKVDLVTYCQGLDSSYSQSGVVEMFEAGGDDIDHYQRDFSSVGYATGYKHLRAGDPVYLYPSVEGRCHTRGAAISELDLTAGVGGIACVGLTLEKVAAS